MHKRVWHRVSGQAMAPQWTQPNGYKSIRSNLVFLARSGRTGPPPALGGKECQPLPIARFTRTQVPGGVPGPKGSPSPLGVPTKAAGLPRSKEGHPGAPCALWTAGPDGTRQTRPGPGPEQPPPRPNRRPAPDPGPREAAGASAGALPRRPLLSPGRAPRPLPAAGRGRASGPQISTVPQTPPKPNSALSLRVSRTGKATGAPLYLPGSPPPRPAPEGPQPLRAHLPRTPSSRSRRPRAPRSAWTSSASSRHTSRRTWLPFTRAGVLAALCSSAEGRSGRRPTRETSSVWSVGRASTSPATCGRTCGLTQCCSSLTASEVLTPTPPPQTPPNKGETILTQMLSKQCLSEREPRDTLGPFWCRDLVRSPLPDVPRQPPWPPRGRPPQPDTASHPAAARQSGS